MLEPGRDKTNEEDKVVDKRKEFLTKDAELMTVPDAGDSAGDQVIKKVED